MGSEVDRHGAGKPLVSVVVPTYKRPLHVKEAVDSVLSQTSTDFEVIVVDDGSGEETVSQYSFPEQVKLTCLERNVGDATARNIGVSQARGRYLAFLDSDDIWLPSKLERQVRLLEDNPAAGMVYCHHVLVDESLSALPEQTPYWQPHGDPLREMLRGNFIRTPSAVLMRREVMDECGPFNKDVCACDWDLWLRVLNKYPILSDPEPLILYRVHSGQISGDVSRMRREAVKIQDVTLRWLVGERPDLVPKFRRKFSRSLRDLAEIQAREEGDLNGSLLTVCRALREFPLNHKALGFLFLAPFYALARARLRERVG